MPVTPHPAPPTPVPVPAPQPVAPSIGPALKGQVQAPSMTRQRPRRRAQPQGRGRLHRSSGRPGSGGRNSHLGAARTTAGTRPRLRPQRQALRRRAWPHRSTAPVPARSLSPTPLPAVLADSGKRMRSALGYAARGSTAPPASSTAHHRDAEERLALGAMAPRSTRNTPSKPTTPTRTPPSPRSRRQRASATGTAVCRQYFSSGSGECSTTG